MCLDGGFDLAIKMPGIARLSPHHRQKCFLITGKDFLHFVM